MHNREDEYKVYVNGWYESHCTLEEMDKAENEYREAVNNGDFEGTFDEYLFEYGVNGSAPACYDEWLQNECADNFMEKKNG